MTVANFPPQIPSAHPILVMPKHPHIAKRSTSGGETRIRLSNVRAGAELSLVYNNIENSDLFGFCTHWVAARGTARDFQITRTTLGAIESASIRSLLLSTTWKYAEPPNCVDICGGEINRLLHTLQIRLISQPRRIAQNIDPVNPQNSIPRLSSIDLPGAAL